MITRESEQQLAHQELLVDTEDHDRGALCPDCDSLLEQSYDSFENCRYFCDNCSLLVHGTSAISWNEEGESE